MVRDYDLSPSLEDYLEVIWDLEEINTVARVKDISERLEVKRSSVTIALRTLGEKGLVNYSPYAIITLTDEGKRVGAEIRHKHNLLRTFFTEVLGIDIVTANGAACSMEHGLAPSIQNRLETFLSVLNSDEAYRSELIVRMDDWDAVHASKLSPDSQLPLLAGLDSLVAGDECVVFQILGTGAVKSRLMEMGIVTGQAIKILEGDDSSETLQLQLKTFRIALKKSDAAQILVEKRS